MGEKHWRTVELTINGFTYPARYTEENMDLNYSTRRISD